MADLQETPTDPQSSTPPVAPETPPDEPVNIVSPEGELSAVAPHELDAALAAGYRQATPDDEKNYTQQQAYGDTSQQVIAGLEGAAQGVIGPLAPMAEKALGVREEDILGRQKANPWAHGIGETAGLAGGMFTGFGEAALAEKLGALGLETAAKVVPEALIKKLPDIVPRIGAAATKAAIENGFIGGSDEVSKMMLNDPDASVGSAVVNNGLAGALIGGGISAVSPLWKATAGSKLGKVLEDVKGRLKYHLDNPDQVSAITDELQQHYSKLKNLNDETWGATGLKAQDIAKAMPEMNNEMLHQASSIDKKVGAAVRDLIESEDPNAKFLKREYDKYQKATLSPEATPASIFEAGQNLKQQLQEWSKFNKNIPPPIADRHFINTAKNLAYDLRTSLEDTNVWGKAAERQKAINAAASKFFKPLSFFEKRFTTEGPLGREVDPGKINTYLNQIGKPSAELKQGMLKEYLQASDAFEKAVGDIHSNLGLENPIAATPMSLTKQTLEELTPGAKIADYIVNKGASRLSGAALGAGAGALLGSTVGHEGFGALIGEHALGPFFSSILPNLVKPLIETPSNPGAFKAAVDYAASVVKGENIMGKATHNLFKAGREVLPQHLFPTDKERAKLDKFVSEAQQDPEKIMNVAGDTGHYMPNHAQAMGTMAASTVGYLASQKPKEVKQAPLDQTPVISATAKAQYNRQLDIAQQPLVVLHHLKNGTLTQQDVIALHTMYPALYSKLSQQLTDNMIKHISKGEPVPYNTRLGLSLFTAQPLDSTMTPQAIMAAQPQPTPPSPQGSKSTKNLSKLASQAQTPEQARAAEQAQGK